MPDFKYDDIVVMNPRKSRMIDLQKTGHIHTPAGYCYKNRMGDLCNTCPHTNTNSFSDPECTEHVYCEDCGRGLASYE